MRLVVRGLSVKHIGQAPISCGRVPIDGLMVHRQGVDFTRSRGGWSRADGFETLSKTLHGSRAAGSMASEHSNV